MDQLAPQTAQTSEERNMLACDVIPPSPSSAFMSIETFYFENLNLPLKFLDLRFQNKKRSFVFLVESSNIWPTGEAGLIAVHAYPACLL